MFLKELVPFNDHQTAICKFDNDHWNPDEDWHCKYSPVFKYLNGVREYAAM
jgi:hypothetical protein